MQSRRLFLVFTIIAILLLTLQGGAPNTGQASAPVYLRGTFFTIWGDGMEGLGEIRLIYFLFSPHYGNIRLIINGDELTSNGGLAALNRKTVSVQGAWQAGNKSFLVQDVSLVEVKKGSTEGIYGPQPWVSILCKFADVENEPNDLEYFQGMYAPEYPGLNHYWQQQSYELANLEGSGAYGWFVLPHPRDYYLPGGNLDWEKAASECTAVADPYVVFKPYVGINLMFNADLDCCAWGGGWYGCLDDGEVCKVWRTTWEPPWGYQNIGVIAHETGHGFDLPHSLGNCRLGYDNRWDVMSSLWYNVPPDPIYGTMGQHTISYHKELDGWILPEQVYTAEPGTIETITLERIALPQSGGYLGSRILINGLDNYFYTLEARQKATDPINYDQFIPGSAVIIHEVAVNRPEPAILVNPNGNCNTSDEGAMWKPGEVFVDIPRGISVSIDSATDTGYVVTINNRFTLMEGVGIDGAESGFINETIPFTATISPMDATTPITYTWEVTGFPPIVHVGDITDSIHFNWEEPGFKTISVTASNEGGSVVDSWSIIVYLKVYMPIGLRY
jgi:M6 family metalloprotease-like protein